MNMTSLNNSYNNNQPTFKANSVKKPSTFISLAARAAWGSKKYKQAYDSFAENVMAKKIIAPIMNSKVASKFAEATKNNDKVLDILTTTGSFVTTTTYAATTLKKKDLEKKPARTLALNQILVTVLSTVGAFTINDGIANFTKKMGYRFRDLNQHLPDKVLSKRMTGFKAAQKLLTFTLMYRYISPVLVTPAASFIGKALNNNEPHTKQSKTPKAKTQKV